MVWLHCPGYLLTCGPSSLQDQELPGATTVPFMPVTSVQHRPGPRMLNVFAEWQEGGWPLLLPSLPGLPMAAPGTQSSIFGFFTFVPSTLAPFRIEGKSPLDMHRLCGLISGRGQGGREKRGLSGE